MRSTFLLLVLMPIILFAQLNMKRVTFLNSGLRGTVDGSIVCGDVDRDDTNELIFRTLLVPVYPYYHGWQIWKYHPTNQYQLVYVDTSWSSYGTHPLGTEAGNLVPFAAGDLDGDSIVDLVGMNRENWPPESVPRERPITTVQEGLNPFSYPESIVWFDRLPGDYNAWSHYITDLDKDGRKEILFRWYSVTYDQGTRIYENTGNIQFQLVFYQPPVSWNTYAFGDFDLDSMMEIAIPGGYPYKIYIRECTGDNQYPLVCSLPFPQGLTNPHDCWDGRDVDVDGKPEFFVAFCNAVTNIFYLYMWEATGNNTYEGTFIDQKTINVSWTTNRRSKCADIDGDGIEEIVWATPVKLFIYKTTGNNQFQQVWEWYSDHGSDDCLITNICDMNKNGYNEIIVGGNVKTSIFEVEAVRLIGPNGGEVFHADSSELIQWQKFYPPRCDSLSLFYSIDNGINYTMITHGLSSNDTSYLWTVPNIISDSCKIKIIAYGPGWQYDESDGVFSITTTGIEEHHPPEIKQLSLKISPNLFKTQTLITLSLPEQQKVSLRLFDISGKLIKVLCDENMLAGVHKINLNGKDLSSSVYFLALQTSNKKIIERFVIVK